MLLGKLKTTVSQGDNRTHKFTNIVLLVPMVIADDAQLNTQEGLQFASAGGFKSLF